MAQNAMDLQMEIDGVRFDGAQKGLNALAGLIAVPFSGLNDTAKEVLIEIFDGIVDAMEQRHGDGFARGRSRPSGPGLARGERTGKLQKRSGRLLKNLKASVDISTSGAITVTGRMSLDKIGAVHEVGATIRPRNSKYLAIPFDAALKADGTPKKRRPRDWPNTFILKSKKGNLLIMQKRGGKLIPLYLLKREVKIPPRLGLGVTIDAAAPVFVDRLFERLVQRLTSQRPRDSKGKFI